MTRTNVPVDVDVLREEIQKTYADVATDGEREFIFPTGRMWARELGYPEPELSRVPDATAVGLDLGCGAGTDLLVAAQMTGPAGRVIGVDMTSAMLSRARASAREMGR